MKVVDNNTKTQLSLAAALFFSPLVQYILRKDTRDITDKDRDFIRGYIKFGYITLLFWLITIVSWVMNYFFMLKILNVTYTISIFILIFLLVISVVSILSDISLLKGRNTKPQNYTIEGNKKDIIVKYLPVYNIYLWYTVHTFDKPNRRIKESILLWMLFLLVSMLGNIFISSTLLILIIFRVAALMSDIDFLTIPIKQRLNKLFLKNPEEIMGYVTWLFLYILQSFVHIFVPMPAYSLQTAIVKEKESYSRIIDIHNNTNIIIEYMLWILLMIWLVYTMHIDFTIRTYAAWFWLLILRYIIMVIQLKHLPHLPIARELFLLVKAVIRYGKKLFIHNQ